MSTTEVAPAPCPKCGGPVPMDTIWAKAGKFYCSQPCAQPIPSPYTF